jgi:Tol biopolymer transport system component
VRNGALAGVPFDPEQVEILGPEKSLLENEVFSTSKSGTAYYDLAGDGLLVYALRDKDAANRRLVEVDREGRTQAVTPTRRAYANATYSPDGRRLAVAIQGGTDTDLWIVDRASNSWSRLVADSDILTARWHPDGRRLLVRSKNRQPPELLLVTADGSAPAERIFEHPNLQGSNSFSPDGRLLTVTLRNPQTRDDIFLLEATGTFGAFPDLSPDGQRVVYVPDEPSANRLRLVALPGFRPDQDRSSAPAR